MKPLRVALLCAGVAAEVHAQRANVKGTVRDSATQQPVGGAIVSIRVGDKRDSVRSDEEGRFTFGWFPLDSGVIGVRRIGYQRREWPVVLRRDTSVTLAVAPQARLLASVRVGATGAGVYGVVARARDLHPISGATVFVAGSGITAVSDSVGEYYVPLKGPGAYVVRVTIDGFAEDAVAVVVKRDQLVQSSWLLDESNAKPISAGLWQDFDQRIRFQTPNNAAILTGAELRASGPSIVEAMRASPEFLKKGLALNASMACLFVNGVPRPGMTLDMIAVDDVRAIEVYSDIKKDEMYIDLDDRWPPGATCGRSSSAVRPADNPRRAKPLPKVKWIVVWTKPGAVSGR